VAEAITWETLRELAAFRAVKGCAISLYLSLDPSEVPTAPAVQTRLNSLLATAERRVEERKSSLTHREREALKGDLGRLRDWFESEFDRDGVRGVAVFAAGLDNLWQPLLLAEPIDDAARVDGELYLAPLVPLVGRPEGALVAYVGRERADVYRLRNGRLVEIADRSTEVPGQHDQGGWSQARYGRHIEAVVARHLAEVAETLNRCVQRRRGVPVVLVGPEEVRSEFEQVLAGETRACIVGWAQAEAHADATQLLAAALPLFDEWRERRDGELLDRWREEAAKDGRAAAGWEQTLEAASDGRVDLLLVQEGVDRQAYRCPACGRAQMTDGTCPLDGTTLVAAPAGLDLAVHQTLNHGGTVRVLPQERRDLEPVGGVAALLRF
jgi:peptide chain release factor subunit 1